MPPPSWKRQLLNKDDDDVDDNDLSVDSDSANNGVIENQNAPPIRCSSRISKLVVRMNLATWICYLSTLHQIISDFKHSQAVTLNRQHNYNIYHATVDNLINDSHSFVYATGFAKNEVFHLGDMLKQDDKGGFFKAMDKKSIST